MRTFLVFGVIAVAMMASPAFAGDISGPYDVKFEEMGTGCRPPPVALGRGKLSIESNPKHRSVTVNIETIPEMAGVPQKGGKVNAKTIKALPTTVQGLDAKYSIGGKVDDSGMLQLVFVAEYIRSDTKKPYCTQSWNVTGVKGTPDKPDKPAHDRKK
jgi:hypothetical protein